MQFSKQVTVYRCDICGNDIPWSGNEMYEDAKKRDSGLLHDWCNDCYAKELMKFTVETRAIALGTTPQALVERILAHYADEGEKAIDK